MLPLDKPSRYICFISVAASGGHNCTLMRYTLQISASLYFALFSIATGFAQKAFLQQQPVATMPPKLKWRDLEDAGQLNETKGKTLVSIYTDWCTWCRKMETETFAHPEIVGYLKSNFQLVRFDAEQKGMVEFDGHTYGPIRIGQRVYNELAYSLLNGRMAFPALVFLNEDLEVIQVIPGFKTPQELLPILVYFGSDEYKFKPWPVFLKSFRLQE